MNAVLEQLNIHWQSTVDSLSLRVDVPLGWAEQEYSYLLSAYDSADRQYHNLGHILDCLNLLEQHSEIIEDPLCLMFVAWYHDCIYEQGATDNEKVSAERAYTVLSELDEALAVKVSQLIKYTEYATYKHSELSNDAQIFHDIDHFSFAKGYADFKQDCVNLRLEQKQADDGIYREQRRSFLSGLIEHGNGLFVSRFFQKTYGAVAEENIHKAMAELDY